MCRQEVVALRLGSLIGKGCFVGRVAMAAVIVGSFAACSSDGYGGSGSSGTTATTATGGDGTAAAGGATISNFSFALPASVAAGTPFTVTNDDGTTHTFTNPDGAFDVTVPAGGSAEVTVATAGTYTVVCKIHSSMSATLTVS